MVFVRWTQFPGSDVVSFNVYRAMIGVEASFIDVSGKSLTLALNGDPSQTINFTTSNPIADINLSLVGGKAYLSDSGTEFIIRSDIREAPGSIEIISGTALVDLGLSPITVTEKSNPVAITNILAAVDPTTQLEFEDKDGSLLDYYSITTINSLSDESNYAPFQQPIAATRSLCVVEGLVANLQGARIPDALVEAVIELPPEVTEPGAHITKDTISTLSGVDGRFQLPILQGALVSIRIPEIGYDQMVEIPLTNFVFLEDLEATTEAKFLGSS